MNITEDEYYTPILLSIPATGEGVPAFLAALADTICDRPSQTPGPFLIIHTPAVALATATAGDRRTLISSLSPWIKAGRLTVWNAGYAGAAVDLLNDDEFFREREWATDNPWRYGFGTLPSGAGDGAGTESGARDATHVLGTPRYFPFRLRTDQARELLNGAEAVCVGYASPPRPGVVSELVLGAGTGPTSPDNTSTIRARYLALEPAPAIGRDGTANAERGGSAVSYAASEACTGATDQPADVNHIILPRGISDTASADEIADAIRRITAVAAPQRDTATNHGSRSSPDVSMEPLTYRSGVAPYAPEREPAVVATLARLRERGETGDTAMRRILCAAGDRTPAGRRVIQAPEIDDRVPLPYPPPHDRELQGGSSGSLTMQEGALRVSFFGGRLSGISANGEPPPRERRSQGFLRRSTPETAGRDSVTDFLETAFAAWFTGTHTRGIQEHASLGETVTVESTAVMIDGFPALLFGQRVTIAEAIPSNTTEVSVCELPLCSVDNLEAIGVAFDGNSFDTAGRGDINGSHAIDIAALRGEAQQDLLISGRHVILDLPHGALRISAAARAAELRVPFRFAVVPKAGTAMLVLRTVPYLHAPAVTRLPAGRTWTVSYLFSPASVPVDSIVVTPEIAAETCGFTYVAAASRRSR